MRQKMKEELLAQMEFNAQSMMSWDEKVKKYGCVYITLSNLVFSVGAVS